MYSRFFGAQGQVAAIGAALAGATAFLLSQNKVECSDDPLHPTKFPWSHNLPWESLDYRSVRRGHQVYMQVCSTCHGLKSVAFRHLVNVIYTEAEAKALAKSVQISDGPDPEGEMYTRPGKLIDYHPSPYPNENAARFANNGAAPPDLSVMAIARHGGENYIFSLLTGYRDPPAGIKARDGVYYNPYFHGGMLAMAPPLSEGQVEYEDGTPSSVSQMAKDVSTFISWASQPEQDARKLLGLKIGLMIVAFFIPATYMKRYYWSVLKNRKMDYWK